MKPEKFFNTEKEYFLKKVAREFNLKAFARLLLIRISIELQFIHWRHLL